MANQANVNVIKHFQVYQEGSESYEGQHIYIPKLTSKLVDGGGLYLSCVVVYFQGQAPLSRFNENTLVKKIPKMQS